MSNPRKLKIIVLGEAGVGKTSLLVRFRDKTFKEKYKFTTVDRFYKTLTVNDTPYLLEIWDTAGLDRFRSLVKGYFRGSDGVLLVYDVTDITTFNKLETWMKDLKKENDTAKVLIVGNKNEEPDKKTVNRTVVRGYAQMEELEYLETSAKTGDNVNEVFEVLTRKILGLAPIPSQRPSVSNSISDEDVNEAADVITLHSQIDTGCTRNNFIFDLPPIVALPDDSIIRLCADKDNLKKDDDSCCVIL